MRNVAIIAHVDHGKTTLVDQLFRQSGLFRENQQLRERLMDSMDLEQERGITITSKNGAYSYQGYTINIIDTPGHADFGGQVERVLRMADGALLLVDAQEGPMPQTYFVVKKALGHGLPLILVVNKIDKPAARPHWVVDQVFDLLVRLDAPDHILDFPVVFASAKAGYAKEDPDGPEKGMELISRLVIDHVPPPQGDPTAPLQMQITSIDYSPYLGRLGIGKVVNGAMEVNGQVALCMGPEEVVEARITKLFAFRGNEKVAVDRARAGEIVAVAGMEEVTVGVTIADPVAPTPLPMLEIDPPTISMHFIPNDSPFAGREGRFITSRHLEERLRREVLADVALQVESLGAGLGFRVSGRGELHLSILIEKMRREGYEFQVTRPKVIFKEEGGQRLEPYELVTIECGAQFQGPVIERLGRAKGRMREMEQQGEMVRLVYSVPTRGLLGFRPAFLTETKGMGVMNYVFEGYGPYAGEIPQRSRGALVVKEACTSVAYALFNLQNRGRLFIGPGEQLYGGQIIGEHSRPGDLVVNPAKGKKLTNMRAAGSDDAVILTPPLSMDLEACLSFINDDELVEVTPKAVRLRKINRR